ncbi:hypothetical protein DM867_11835 [Halosegnis rubeus]|jgi:hypothetical protein|uniref:Uncharacterized protein n=2 Tax=Natronomonadaceae TaxID=3402413 RepID=A0A5N5U2F8_9EURY|nr:hypothetical protein DM867_11835 [Halosegnis rubeus]KAB7515562.1 hypothetical protein DP108_11430 [Halosegnis rubeus]KAB7518535.1 hypothetical protein DMP03_04035 [Halosegnis rubeus]
MVYHRLMTELPTTTDAAEPTPEPTDLTVEAYETEGGVVFYDAAEPAAWLQADETLDLEEML